MSTLSHTGDHRLSNLGNVTINNGTGQWTSVTWSDPVSDKFDEISERLETIEKRLAIVIPNEDLLNRFPALREAYDHYKLVEKLVNDHKEEL